MNMSFKVGDMVKYRSEILTDAQTIGYIVEMGNNGYSEWAKVQFFDNNYHQYNNFNGYPAGNGYSIVYVEKLVKA